MSPTTGGESLQRLSIQIRGKVQGVFFRREASREARRFSLSGFIRNEPDGSVYAEAEGAPSDVGGFIRWCRKGPSNARIESVETREIKIRNDDEFEVEY